MMVKLNCDELQNELEQMAAESVQPLNISSACKLALRALAMDGVNRMELEERLTDEDVSIARANLKRFIREMKIESVFLGHAGRLDYDSFLAAHRQFEKHAVLAPFTLWPFWPNQYCHK